MMSFYLKNMHTKTRRFVCTYYDPFVCQKTKQREKKVGKNTRARTFIT